MLCFRVEKEKRSTGEPTDISSSGSARCGARRNYSSLSCSLSLLSVSLALTPPPLSLALFRAAPPHCPVPLPSPHPALGEHPCTRVTLRSGPSKTSLPSHSIPSCASKLLTLITSRDVFYFWKNFRLYGEEDLLKNISGRLKEHISILVLETTLDLQLLMILKPNLSWNYKQVLRISVEFGWGIVKKI